MTKRLRGLTWCLLLAAATGFADDNQGRYHVLGLGTDRCDEFIASIDQQGQENPWLRFNLYTAYATGFLSSYNQYVDDTVDIKGTRSMLEIMSKVEEHCRQHALDDFHSGLMHAIDALKPYRER
jgi:hypothetical protein